MIVGEIGVVSVKGEPGFRVVQLRPLIERDHASPVEGARRAIDRSGTVAGLSQGDQAGVQEADVAAAVGKDQVLGRCLIEAERVEKFGPVSRGIDPHEGLRRSCRDRQAR